MSRLSIWVICALLCACGPGDAPGGETGGPSGDVTGGDEAAAEGLRRYQIESAVVTYELTGTPRGTEVLSFDRYGAREVSVNEHVMETGGQSIEMNSSVITEGPWITNVDRKEKRALRFKNPLYDDLLAAAAGKDPAEVGESLMQAMGGQQVGDEEILGRPCVVWELPQVGKAWIWKGLVLKAEPKSGMVDSVKVAVSIEEGAEISDALFEVPADYDLSEFDTDAALRR